MDRDWRVFGHVAVDENEIVIAQRDTHPDLGLMPTRKWNEGAHSADEYGDYVACDGYTRRRKRESKLACADYATGERLLVNGRDVLTCFIARHFAK